MPAHIRTALTAVNLSLPVRAGKPALGTWQGIYLWEHRTQATLAPRRVAFHRRIKTRQAPPLMAACRHCMQALNCFRCAALTALVLAFVSAVRGGNATNSLGFTGPEFYPIDDGINLLHAADLDGDGLNDLIVVNNLRSKINLLYNRTGKTNDVADGRAAAQAGAQRTAAGRALSH